MSHHDHHYVIARSVSAKDQNDPETGGDRNSNDRDFVSKKIFHGRYGQDSPGYRGKAMLNCSHRTEEYSKHSEEDLVLEKELHYVIEEQDLIHEGGPDVSSSEVAKSKSFLSLKIYDADEALMEIPPDFEGPAIILDDDADFLDITLTDDEEKIRAKLMAAALTTRKSTSSISPNSSLKTRPSIEPRSLSYEPSVIFTRRSEVLKDNYAPRPNDRVALLAEKFLKSFSESATDDSGWKPSTQEVCSTEYTLHFFGGKGVTKRGGDTPLLVDRQLLSEEFNRKLHRQLKVIVESFQ
ncbi:uncharacterized protein LOC122620585 isoform X5 [Drosophila teissieri]|uniref:uncharacterized protein LOC122620585 isoform X5 n=1 Tax=Drosophila teissieri TaxID=7243 RepID=UPI001CB9EB6D|nr:uncharacterized protein LOC122620585 isoform X5 [Drosophila teissieri]